MAGERAQETAAAAAVTAGMTADATHRTWTEAMQVSIAGSEVAVEALRHPTTSPLFGRDAARRSQRPRPRSRASRVTATRKQTPAALSTTIGPT
jgi:hypothetical protein